MNVARTSLLRDVRSEADFIWFASNHHLYKDGFICCRTLFSIMGFNNKVLSTAIKRYISATKVNPNDVLISEVSSKKYYLAKPTVACEFVKAFRSKNLIYGYSIRDIEFPVKVDGKLISSYRKWCGMLERCYSDKWHKIKPSYQACEVSEEWLLFSKFHDWFEEHSIDGYVLDKDILCKGNKKYAKEFCVFVPSRINGLLINRQNDRGNLPQGVTLRKDRCTRIYEAAYNNMGKRIHIGFYDCPQKAFLAYKKAKEAFIKRVAQEHFERGEIDKRVYDALCAYEVEVGD